MLIRKFEVEIKVSFKKHIFETLVLEKSRISVKYKLQLQKESGQIVSWLIEGEEMLRNKDFAWKTLVVVMSAKKGDFCVLTLFPSFYGIVRHSHWTQ